MTDSGRRNLPVDPDVPEAVRGRWDVVGVVAVGGALGSAARWGITETLPHSPWRIPWGTFVENVTGAFLLGALMVFVLERWSPSRYVRPFLGVGLLGGYTTFSTYLLETRDLLADGHPEAALAYVLGTLVAGLLAVAAGVVLARSALQLAPGRGRE
jgi:fluoride exporter